MSVGIRKVLDKFFIPCFYGFIIVGLVFSGFLFFNVKQQQKNALIQYEKNLNIKKVNETMKLQLSEKVNDKDLIYTSSNEDIVKVDKKGNLISVGEGSAILTVSTKDNKSKQNITVNVGATAINKYLKKNPKDNRELEKTTPVDSSLT